MSAPGGRVFWAGAAAGGGVMGFGVAGLLRDADVGSLGSWAVYAAGALVVHDALWAPAVALGSVLLARALPGWLRAPVQGALLVSAALVLVAGPALTGEGRLANTPSLLPHDYARNLALVLAVVWAGAALLSLRAWRRRPSPRPDSAPATPAG